MPEAAKVAFVAMSLAFVKGEYFVVGNKRVHQHFVVGDGGGKVVHTVVHHFHEGANWGGIVVSLAPAGWTVKWWRE